MPTDPLHRRTAAVGLACLALPLLLSACSSSTPASDETTTTAGSHTVPPSACDLISPSEIKATLGTSVAQPTAKVDGSVTACTYKASPLARSVIIEYNDNASATSFAADKATIAQHLTVTPIQGLGNKAYSFSQAAHPYAANTVVTIQNSLQTIVTSTSSMSQVKTMAEEILYMIDQHNAKASSTTPTTSP
jgi:hypothetical protein